MKVCVLSAVIVAILTNCACAAEEKEEDNLVTTYDPGVTSSEAPIGPRLPLYDEIKAGDQPDHHPESGHIRFEDEPPNEPDKPENDFKEEQHPYIDKTELSHSTGNVSYDVDQNDRILTPDDNFESDDLDHKIDFDEPPNFPFIADPGNEEPNDDDETEHESNAEQTPDTGEQKFDGNESEVEDIEAKDEEPESPDEEENLDAENESSEDKNNVTERIVSEENGKKDISEPITKKKRRPRRKPRKESLPEEPTSMTQNPFYPGLGYPGYPGYPAPSYPNPLDSNSAYTNYPQGYPPGYPAAYPGYPNPYPASPYPTPGYPSYPYQPGYPGAYPGYGTYPAYQPPGQPRPPSNPRPQENPPPYPGSNDQETQADTKHPVRDNSGVASAGQPLPNRPDMYPGQEYAAAGYSGYPAQAGYPGYGGYGYAADPNSQYGQYRPYPGYPGYYRAPLRRPKTLTQRAISAVAEALTSIALFDDKQCVPRLLCEVASGSTASSPTLQKATAGLGPLLTVLQSYNGISSSPLFLFGRAAVLGMTSRGSPTACKYAYAQCPNDPESLIEYLNNHNGGFFRFFGQPEGGQQQQQQQNLEQFYSHLAGQYGYQQTQQQQQIQQQQIQQQPNYGYPYGYGMQNPYPQQYGANYYREQNTFRNSKEIDSETSLSNIEERIQNKPGTDAVEEDKKETGSKWAFPDENSNKKEEKPKKPRRQKEKKPAIENRPTRGERGGGSLKFPDERGPSEDRPDIDREREFIRNQKGIFFPSQNHFNIESYQATTPANDEEYVFDYQHNFYVKRPKQNTNTANNDGLQTVYVVRGNGDPNHPEVVKVRPGQSP